MTTRLEMILCSLLAVMTVGCAGTGYHAYEVKRENSALAQANAGLTSQVNALRKHDADTDAANNAAKDTIRKALDSLQSCQQ